MSTERACMTVEIQRLWDGYETWIIIWKESGNEAQKEGCQTASDVPGKIFICTVTGYMKKHLSMEEQGVNGYRFFSLKTHKDELLQYKIVENQLNPGKLLQWKRNLGVIKKENVVRALEKELYLEL